MSIRPARLLAAIALAVCSTAVSFSAAGAVPGPGTFTRITTPSGASMTYHYTGSSDHFTVSGQASIDVTSVDIVCIFIASSGPSSQALVSGVAVTGGAFSAVAVLSHISTNCRLRALPTGVDVDTDYLGSFSGPILYNYGVLPSLDAGSKKYGFIAVDEEADGIGEVQDAGTCGVVLVATVATPAMEVRGPGTSTCAFALPGTDLNSAASSIRVSGHNAYLPGAVHTYLIGVRGLALTQSSLTTSFTRAANGDLTVTEAAPLMRCSGSDVFPPTSVSCPTLVAAGVRFTRVSLIFRSGHQVRLRDTFTSTDGVAHAITAGYESSVQTTETGSVGYDFPGGASTFAAATPDQQVTGLGSKAAAMFIRSDLYSVEGDPTADTHALTWSRAPAKVFFSHASATQFQMSYALTVPAGASAYLGFADSQNVTTAGVKTLAPLANNDMMAAPTITSPASGAVLSTTATSIRGALSVGANGMPTSVGVNGHAATITKTSATTATYRADFSEPVGTHTITVTAHDAAGNTKAASITVRNA